MQFLKSLFCLQGLDNRARFFAICCAVYIIFIMVISAFTGKFFISLAILALFTPILAFTCLRRLNDAKLNKKWLFIPTLVFVITSLIIIFSQSNGSYYLLAFPAICLAALLTYPSVRNKNSRPVNYVLGYFGPVDMTEYQQITHQGKLAKFRIEPTIVGSDSVEVNSNEQAVTSSHEAASPYLQNNKKIDLGETIRLKLFNNKKIFLALVIIFTITLVSICGYWLMKYLSSNSTDTKELEQVTQKSNNDTTKEQVTLERNHPLAMPDNFSLFLSQHQGIIINWQADEISIPLLWSQTTAQGESSCQQISFNKGESIRTLAVHVENGEAIANGVYNNYFATFSPLDSKALIQALAFRGNFSLCGYNFSLKGSQAALGQNKNYADWVEY